MLYLIDKNTSSEKITFIAKVLEYKFEDGNYLINKIQELYDVEYREYGKTIYRTSRSVKKGEDWISLLFEVEDFLKI
jgi:hypothetical protein